jgi:hypothetical protein
MNREEQIKAAIVVNGNSIGFASPEMNKSAQALADGCHLLVNWLQKTWPFLERHEATIIAAATLGSIPELFENNPQIMQGLNIEALQLISNRPTNR